MTELEPKPQRSASEPASTGPSSTAGSTAAQNQHRRAESVHDFSGKLRQPELWSRVVDYIAWQRHRRAAVRRGEQAPPALEMAPLSINLDLTTACNYACDHCIDWDILNSKVRHADEELRESMRVMTERGMRSVILIGGGEPTLYPGFADFVRYLKELNLQVAVVTNGSRNDRIMQIAPYLTAGDWVRLSLDSGSNQTFRAMHKPSKPTLDLDEICSWIPKIKAVNSEFQIGYSFSITWQGASRDDVGVVENIDEMAEAARRARDAEFNYISFKPFLERSGEGSEIMAPEGTDDPLADVTRRIDAQVAAARELEIPGFRVMESTNLRVLMRGNWRDFTSQPKTCHMQALRQVVTPLGVFNCPAYRGVQRAKIGDKNAYAGEDAANGGAERTAELLDRFDASHECREVTCLYNSANWWIEEMIESGADIEGMAEPRQSEDYFL